MSSEGRYDPPVDFRYRIFYLESHHSREHECSHLMEPIRLQKYLADAGICSRRAAEALIVAGEVWVNSKKAETARLGLLQR